MMFKEGDRVARRHPDGVLSDVDGSRWMLGDVENGRVIWDRDEPVGFSDLSDPDLQPAGSIHWDCKAVIAWPS